MDSEEKQLKATPEDDQDYRHLENARREEIAGKKTSEMDLPKKIDAPEEISGLGRKIQKLYADTRDTLATRFGAEFPRVLAVAVHEYWFACWDGAVFFQANIDDKSFYDNEYTRKMTTPEGYADVEGWADTLMNGFADVVPSTVRRKWIWRMTGHDVLDVSTALRCMTLYWLYQASIQMERGNSDAAFDLVREAHAAITMDVTNITYEDVWEEARKTRSEVARNAGRKAHVEDYALKAEVKKFWLDNISSTIGNDAAATILIRHFPLKFRTLSGYVSEFKSELKNTAG